MKDENNKIDGIRIVSYILAVLFIISIFAKFFIDKPVPEASSDTNINTEEVKAVESDLEKNK